MLTTLTAQVVGQHLFYNNSAFDLNVGVDANDDLAIAVDKTAYLPGQPAMSMAGFVASGPNITTPKSLVHVSSYSRGINGLMIDISGPHGAITSSDFSFRVGNNNFPGIWA